MKILVLGGTGAMGMHLVQLLKEKGAETFVTSRRNIKSDKNLHYLQGNAKNLVFLQRCLQLHEWDAIVDFMVYDTQTFEERFALLLNNTKQYIFLSSARVYADSEEPMTESFPRLLNVSKDIDFLKTDEYSLTKARQEDVLRNSEYQNWTIIRPYITYSENRLQLGTLEKEEWLYRALRGRTIVFSRDIASKITTLTYGLDVSQGILAIIGNSKALGEEFHITSSVSIIWDEVLEGYLKVLEKYLGYKPKVLLQELDKTIELVSKRSNYQFIYDRMFNRTFDNSKISQYLDTDGFMNVENGLNQCLEKFLENPQFKRINWQQQAQMDKMCNEKTPLSEIQGIKQKVKYLLYRFIN